MSRIENSRKGGISRSEQMTAQERRISASWAAWKKWQAKPQKEINRIMKKVTAARMLKRKLAAQEAEKQAAYQPAHLDEPRTATQSAGATT